MKIHSAALRRAELPCRTVPCVLEKYLLIPQCRFCKRRKSLIRLWEIRSFIMENCRACEDGSRLFFRLFLPSFLFGAYVIYKLHWIVYKYIVKEIVSIEDAWYNNVRRYDKLHCDTFVFIIALCFRQSNDFKIYEFERLNSLNILYYEYLKFFNNMILKNSVGY